MQHSFTGWSIRIRSCEHVEGYHCSRVQKPYWNTIYLDDFPEKELYNMIDFAYDTVLHSFSKKVQKQILENV